MDASSYADDAKRDSIDTNKANMQETTSNASQSNYSKNFFSTNKVESSNRVSDEMEPQPDLLGRISSSPKHQTKLFKSILKKSNNQYTRPTGNDPKRISGPGSSLVDQEPTTLVSVSPRFSKTSELQRNQVKDKRIFSCSLISKSYSSSNDNKGSGSTATTGDHMHRFYKARLKHSLIVSFLLLIPIQSMFFCILGQFAEQVSRKTRRGVCLVKRFAWLTLTSLLASVLFQDKEKLLLETITFIFVSIFSIMLMFYLIRNEVKLQNHPLLISLCIYVLITLNHIVPLLRSQSRHLAAIEYGSFVLFNIIAIYSILPLDRRWTIFLSTLISLKNYMLLCFLLLNSKLSYIIVTKKVSLHSTTLDRPIRSTI